MNDMQKEIMRSATKILMHIGGPDAISRAVAEAKTIYDEVLNQTGAAKSIEDEYLVLYRNPAGHQKYITLKEFKELPTDISDFIEVYLGNNNWGTVDFFGIESVFLTSDIGVTG